MSLLFHHGHALLIGVGGNLPATIRDAKGMYQILTDTSRCAYPPMQVDLLTGEQASRENIIAKLDSLKARTDGDAEATVIIYFSGHGGFCPDYHLVAHAYNGKPDTMVSGVEFSERIDSLRAKKVLVLLDCCHAAGMVDLKSFVKSPLPPELETILQDGAGRVALASSTRDEISFAGNPYSVFTQALRESLAGAGNSEKDGLARVADIAMYLSKVIPQRTKGAQNPVLKLKAADNFVVAYYAAGAKEALPLNETSLSDPEPGEDAADLRAELEAHQSNLRELRKQSIKFGSLYVPLYLLNAIKDEEQEIDRLRKRLDQLPS
jgi:uncharacterized caspase-like protein